MMWNTWHIPLMVLRIAFVSEREDNDVIYVMNADGSNPIRLTQNYRDVEYLAYSPDGSQNCLCF